MLKLKIVCCHNCLLLKFGAAIFLNLLNYKAVNFMYTVYTTCIICRSKFWISFIPKHFHFSFPRLSPSGLPEILDLIESLYKHTLEALLENNPEDIAYFHREICSPEAKAMSTVVTHTHLTCIALIALKNAPFQVILRLTTGILCNDYMYFFSGILSCTVWRKNLAIWRICVKLPNYVKPHQY